MNLKQQLTNFASKLMITNKIKKMKVIFVVQGEGRGHLTQALALEKALEEKGHQVIEILVGKSKSRQLPDFFLQRAKAPVDTFWSPNFLPSKKNQHIGLTRSMAYNFMKSSDYLQSIQQLYQYIQWSGADLVVNFYEILTGLTYAFLRPSVPEVCIGHQYMFMHPQYRFPHQHTTARWLMLAFTRATCWGAAHKLALSFRKMPDCDKQHLSVVPPLLREEVLDISRHRDDFITGYIINAGFSEMVKQWHQAHPHVKLHFFWDKADADEVTKIDDTLTFHRIDDTKFLHYLANCRAYATTGGFESVCEAMYMGKPVLMVPAHIEQECNAHEASLEGAGIKAETFDISQLIDFTYEHSEDVEFRMWENTAKMMIVSRLEAVVERSLHIGHRSWSVRRMFSHS